MTNLEKELLQLLRTNARMTINDLAVHLSSTEKKVQQLIQALEEKGVINGYTALVNPTEMSKNGNPCIRAFVELSVSPEKKKGYDGIAKRIYQYPNVLGHYLLSGQYDFLVIVEGSSHEEIAAFVFDKLATIDSVQSTNTHFVFTTYKDNGHTLSQSDSVDRVPVIA